MYLVRCGHFWSRDKDGVTPFDLPEPKSQKPMLHGNATESIRSTKTLASFKRNLKTHLFNIDLINFYH